MEYDAVIIGSGLGGLVSGYILSKNGMKVAVFEKQPVIGGCLQSFSRGGVRFETGMHYIGSMGEGETLYRYFKYLSLVDKLKLSRLDDSAYEIISVGGERYSYAGGYEPFIDNLSRKFPARGGQIRQYVNLCHSVTESSPMYSFGDHRNIAILNPDHVKRSVSEVIDSITDDQRLRNVLVGINPLYGGERNITPLYIHTLIWDFYNKGAYRIAGGSDAIAASLCSSIKAMGGDVFPSSEITAVNCDQTKAVSVTVRGMGVIPCRNIISDIHPQRLISLVDSHLLRRVYRDRISSLRQGISNFSVYMKFKDGRVPYLNSNFYHYSDNVWDCGDYDWTSWPKNYLYMHQCTADGQKYATHAIVFGYMRWEDVAMWENTSVGQRGEDYIQFKARCADKLLGALENEFPGIRSCIDSYWTSSPLTYRDYTGTIGGSMYGVLRDKSNLNQTMITQRTKIPNLFLAGQNVNSHGILGVTIGAVLACSELLGFNYLVDQIKEVSR